MKIYYTVYDSSTFRDRVSKPVVIRIQGEPRVKDMVKLAVRHAALGFRLIVRASNLHATASDAVEAYWNEKRRQITDLRAELDQAEKFYAKNINRKFAEEEAKEG